MNEAKELEEMLKTIEGVPVLEPPKLPIPKGTRVRMSPDLKRRMREIQPSGLHSRQHVKEFGRCVGIVEGFVDYNNCQPSDPAYDVRKIGPEVEVRWRPSMLRYAYHPDQLQTLSWWTRPRAR